LKVLLIFLLLTSPALAQQSLLADVERERAKYGAWPTDGELCLILNDVAWKHKADGWALSAKPNGTNCTLPNGQKIAHDILHHKPTNTLYDVFFAAGEIAEPRWFQVVHHNDPSRPAIGPFSFGGTGPICPECPLAVDFSDWIRLLEARIKEGADRLHLLEEGHANHGRLLTELKNRPLPVYIGRLGPFTIRSRPQTE
jgi:hypothetical protein